eukprot:3542243-Rhodomonas_salina.2
MGGRGAGGAWRRVSEHGWPPFLLLCSACCACFAPVPLFVFVSHTRSVLCALCSVLCAVCRVPCVRCALCAVRR